MAQTAGATAAPMSANALTVDVEEYYHALVFQEGTRGAPTERLESRVEASIQRVLALMASAGAKATFFVLGQVAAAHPAMVRTIKGQGHEIACHGHRHEPISRLTPEQFRADIKQAKVVLEDLAGEPILGYRAPNFSIGRDQAWAYDILLEEGFRYDSSIYPIRHDSYGDHGAPRFPYELRRQGPHNLMQVPIGTVRLFGMNLPIGGGGYFRLLPFSLIHHGIRRVNVAEKRPIVFYFHPWELDPDQPRPSMPWRNRFRHYVGMRKEEAKLARLLRAFQFDTVRAMVGV